MYLCGQDSNLDQVTRPISITVLLPLYQYNLLLHLLYRTKIFWILDASVTVLVCNQAQVLQIRRISSHATAQTPCIYCTI